MKQTKEEWEEENDENIVEMYRDSIEGVCDVPKPFIESLYEQYLDEDEEE